MTFEWSQPIDRGSCDLQSFSLHMNDGQGSDTLNEIDSSLIRDKPFYTVHTTNQPSTEGATYIF